MVETPSHLGGHLGITHIDTKILEIFKNNYNCHSMLDIGCGPGGQVEEALKLGYDAYGVDGDPSLKWEIDGRFFRHDFQDGPFLFKPVDLVWSCEFVEHVKPEYINNFMTAFKSATKFVAMTFASPNAEKPPNHWHHNEQNANYWIDLFSDYGFKFNVDMTSEMRMNSSMSRNFFRNNGLVFTK